MIAGTLVIFFSLYFLVMLATYPVTKFKKKHWKHTCNMLGIALFKYHHTLVKKMNRMVL